MRKRDTRVRSRRATLVVERFRTIRQSLGLTCDQLAQALGVHRMTVSDWQRYERMKPYMVFALFGLAVRMGDFDTAEQIGEKLDEWKKSAHPRAGSDHVESDDVPAGAVPGVVRRAAADPNTDPDA